jgi:histidyl-tRNA synthetase
VHSLKNAKLTDFVTRIGHLGILRGILSEIGVKDDVQSKCMQLIDKGELEELYQMIQTQDVNEDGIGKIRSLLELEKTQTIPTEIDEILRGNETSQDALKNLRDILRMLKALGVSDFVIDLGIARGLDYYTGMVFEIDVPILGAEKQVCGGGAYSLAELFGAKPTVSTGFAIGFDRVMIALERQNAEPEVPRLMVYMIPLGDEAKEQSVSIAAKLRENSISCDIALLNRKISKHMKHANTQNAKYAIIIGEDEIASEEASVKDMESGEQKKVRFDELIQFFKSQ